MATAQIGIRIDEKEKREFEETTKALGLTTATAIKMFIAKFNRDKGFDFKVTLDDVQKLPEKVEKAMITAKAAEFGLLPDGAETVTNLSDLHHRWTES
jgi:DNA-damage-inducible protein J